MQLPNDSPTALQIVETYLVLVACAFGLKLILAFLVFPEGETSTRFVRAIGNWPMYLGPILISWRFAGRMRRVLDPDEIAEAAGWCAFAEFIGDLIGGFYLVLVSVSGISDEPLLSLDMIPLIFFGLLLKYALVLILGWIILRYPGRWIASFRIGRNQAAA